MSVVWKNPDWYSNAGGLVLVICLAIFAVTAVRHVVTDMRPSEKTKLAKDARKKAQAALARHDATPRNTQPMVEELRTYMSVTGVQRAMVRFILDLVLRRSVGLDLEAFSQVGDVKIRLRGRDSGYRFVLASRLRQTFFLWCSLSGYASSFFEQLAISRLSRLCAAFTRLLLVGAVEALFLQTLGGATHEDTPAECRTSESFGIKFVQDSTVALVGLVISAIPMTLLRSWRWHPFTVPSTGPQAGKTIRLIRTVSFWAVLVPLLLASLLVSAVFLAESAPEDVERWSLVFLQSSVLLILLWPLLISCALVGILSFAFWSIPDEVNKELALRLETEVLEQELRDKQMDGLLSVEELLGDQDILKPKARSLDNQIASSPRSSEGKKEQAKQLPTPRAAQYIEEQHAVVEVSPAPGDEQEEKRQDELWEIFSESEQYDEAAMLAKFVGKQVSQANPEKNK
eukprot:TRINITY_DN12307_c0_g3_i1.p1 TRINITY_DN12307_c0_g3~~TRINITY_DN12307_c0_g3_i1.p1  ORF type:complete len:476 (-),score=89.79 TRINITY_DN12307_c0_g3_i1:232-1602(-)